MLERRGTAPAGRCPTCARTACSRGATSPRPARSTGSRVARGARPRGRLEARDARSLRRLPQARVPGHDGRADQGRGGGPAAGRRSVRRSRDLAGSEAGTTARQAARGHRLAGAHQRAARASICPHTQAAAARPETRRAGKDAAGMTLERQRRAWVWHAGPRPAGAGPPTELCHDRGPAVRRPGRAAARPCGGPAVRRPGRATSSP